MPAQTDRQRPLNWNHGDELKTPVLEDRATPPASATATQSANAEPIMSQDMHRTANVLSSNSRQVVSA